MSGDLSELVTDVAGLTELVAREVVGYGLGIM